jgi:hypothetical protein
MSAASIFLDLWSASVAVTAYTTPRQESTVETTSEQVDLARAMSRAVADMLAEDSDRSVVADRIEQVAAELVASLREQTHIVVDAV